MTSPDIDQQFAESYAELRRLAHQQLSRHQRSGTLDTTALVHESFLRFVQTGGKVEDKRHFLAYSAKVMRSVIVDFARARLAEKRGGDQDPATLNSQIIENVTLDDGVLRIQEALEELEAVDERLCRIVELRFFAGLSATETAQVLEISERTLFREWEKARLILLDALRGDVAGGARA